MTNRLDMGHLFTFIEGLITIVVDESDKKIMGCIYRPAKKKGLPEIVQYLIPL